MNLQSIIDWWRGYVKRKRAVIACGVWPTAVPPKIDIFLKCCKEHDKEYVDSETMYVDGIVNQDKNLKDRALEIKDIADGEFCCCVRNRYKRSCWLFRGIARFWGEQYIALVLANGDRIWFQSIGMQIAEYESGGHPNIKLAIMRIRRDEKEA